MQEIKQKNMRNDKGSVRNTFGASFQRYEKTIVTEGPSHYLGRGPSCDLPQDTKVVEKTKKKVPTISKTTRDRGLLIKPKLWKE